MKVRRINHADPATLPVSADPLRDDLFDIQFAGYGIIVSVSDTGNGISVSIDPSGSRFISALWYHEVAAHDSQIRVSRVRGVIRDDERK